MSLTSCLRKIRGSAALRRLITLVLLVYITAALVYHRPTLTVEHSHLTKSSTTTPGEKTDGRRELLFFLILCDAKPDNNQGGKKASDITRQVRQAAVMLKSAVALSTSVLRFIVVSDSELLYQRLVNTTIQWPSSYRDRLRFHHREVWYPNDRQQMRSMFRVCATERLFLPDMFPDLDAGIYIDTDLIFLRPPEDLWAEFRRFSAVQVAAMGPCLYHYDSKKNKVPHYGTTGLNAGVMLMNLTRMKTFPGGGWTQANMRAFDNHRKDIKLADQDILNILFYRYPERLYELGCDWNYRVFQCSQGRNICPAAATTGVSLLHGCALAFVNGMEMKLQVMFEAWEDHKLGEPLSELLGTLKNRMKEVSLNKTLASKCARVPTIDKILTGQLEQHV